MTYSGDEHRSSGGFIAPDVGHQFSPNVSSLPRSGSERSEFPDISAVRTIIVCQVTPAAQPDLHRLLRAYELKFILAPKDLGYPLHFQLRLIMDKDPILPSA